jgi:hypothetical protein
MAASFAEFFKLPEGEQRQNFLDKVIDEQEARMKEFASRSAEGGPTSRPTDRLAQRRGADTQPGNDRTRRLGIPDGQRPAFVGPGGGGRMLARGGDGPSAEQREQMTQFVQAIQKRREERGLPNNPPSAQRRG